MSFSITCLYHKNNLYCSKANGESLRQCIESLLKLSMSELFKYSNIYLAIYILIICLIIYRLIFIISAYFKGEWYFKKFKYLKTKNIVETNRSVFRIFICLKIISEDKINYRKTLNISIDKPLALSIENLDKNKRIIIIFQSFF